jgi:peptidoglycan hydrolase-like protein with peptidoglycan-binding domain
MRLAAAVLVSVATVAFAAAEPAKQAAPKAETKGATKGETKGEKKAETKGEAKPAATKPAATKAATKGDKGGVAKAILDSYGAIALAERMAIQSDLVWTGDYNGLVNGEFAERAVAAVKAFQKRNGGKETGVLNQPERAALAAAAKPKQEAVGWRMVEDGASGARIGIPGKLVPQQSTIIGGTRWASARAEYSVESFRIAQPGTTLAAVFERMKKDPAGRKADYSVMRDNFFVISGLQNLKKFYVRAQARGEEVRGITVLYDQAMAGIMEPVVVAMSSAFLGFSAAAAPPPRRKVEYASGVAVGAGEIVTSREALEGCHVVTVAGIGGADRLAEDKANGLVLLRVHGASLKPAALGAAAPKGEVTLLGIADPQAQGGGSAVSAARARVSDALALDTPPALGFDGAAALDAQGKLAGIVAIKPAVVAGPAPATTAALTPVEAVRTLLDAQNVVPAPATVTGTEAAKTSVVRVICVRK